MGKGGARVDAVLWRKEEKFEHLDARGRPSARGVRAKAEEGERKREKGRERLREGAL